MEFDRDRVMKVWHGVFGALGVGAAIVMLWHTDFHALRRFGLWAVLVIGVEGTRVVAEALATRSLHGEAVRVPVYPLVRAHLTGYALANTLPAGRAVAEAAKAVMLAPWAEGGRSAVVAATNQSMVLLATGSVSVAWSVAAWTLDRATLAWTVCLQGLTIVALGAGLLAMVRSRAVADAVIKRFPSVVKHVGAPPAQWRMGSVPAAFACFAFHRSVQAAQLFVLMGALGRWDAPRALALAGAAIVGTTVGVVTPGQVGAVGGALALAAPAVGIPVAQALAMALVLHAAQFAWASLGIILWTATPRPSVAAA